MPGGLEVRGTGDFRQVARKLKAAGSRKLTREMSKEMKTAAQPAVQDAQSNIRATSSSAGGRGGGSQRRREYTASRARKDTERTRQQAAEGRGLRESIARAIGARVKATPGSASVRIEVDAKRLPPDQRQLPYYIDAGKWRHPVFGNRHRWVTQTATPDDWWDRAMDRHGPQVRDEAVKVVGKINRDIAR